MIATVTFNPSLDYILKVKDFQPGATNRAYEERLYPGGKGVNVSIMLRHLGFETTCLGFCAGFTGEEIKRRLKQIGCGADFLPLAHGTSRINVKLKSDTETEINAAGPPITDADTAKLMEKISNLQTGDVLVLAGSIPPSLPDSLYEQILRQMRKSGVKIVVDATGELLRKTLASHPFLIKPNRAELSELVQKPLKDEREIIEAATQLQKQGAQNVLVSLGGDGCVLVDEKGHVSAAKAPKGKVVNTVGSGVSMVAGFLAGYLQSGGDSLCALRMGLAAGSASAFEDWLADKPQVMALYEDLLW